MRSTVGVSCVVFVLATLLACAAEQDAEEALQDAHLVLQDARDGVEAAEALVEQRQGAVDRAQAELETANAKLADALARQESAQQVVADKATDAALFRSVQRVLLDDPELEGLGIAARASRGVVTLEGEVDSEAQQAHAVELTAATPGVVRVEARMTVRGPQPEGEAAD